MIEDRSVPMHLYHPAVALVVVGLAAGSLHVSAPWSAAGSPSNRQEQAKQPPPKPGPMLSEGTVTLDTPEFSLTLVRSSQTVAALRPKQAADFDFTPGDLLVARSQNGYYHLGDLDLRLRSGTSGEWKNYSTAQARTPVKEFAVSSPALAAADLTPTLPPDIPLLITRSWIVDGKALVLRFELSNRTAEPVEIGALGIAMVFNNVLTNRSLDQAHATCVFYDPYIGQDAGYLQVVRLTGHGPVLLVIPDDRTPFEAFNPILNPDPQRAETATADGLPPIFTDGTRRAQTFEGFFTWLAHTRAYAENEWKNVTPWNPPTMATLAPGESRSYGVRLIAAADLRSVEKTLADHQRPVAVGIPGYVLPRDIDARLFLQYPKPVTSIEVDPRDAIAVTRDAPTSSGWNAYTLRGKSWGRARLSIVYEDGTRQAVHYFVTKPQGEAVDDLGRFLTTRHWFEDPNDPFKRSPSVMTYDRDENAIVMQDSRVWIAGLGDEGGSSWLTGAIKQLGRPDKAEIDKYQQFIDRVVWGGLQYSDGPRQHGVRKSLFYYQPDEMPEGYYRGDFNWGTWTSWNRAATEVVDRSYNYPHVAGLYWTMYRLARNNTGLVTNRTWEWYLENAHQTTLAMVKHAPRYAQFGQMEGTVFLEILRDLQREGWGPQAAAHESAMKARAEIWMKLNYPYGSEMPWDSTGQEEVYAWTKYFGDTAKAAVTLNAILAYMPSVPHWGYNGSARRYWDFIYAGKLRRLERQLHHYGSTLNAIPVLSEYRDRPDDLYLLRVGYGGVMGGITNIDEEGFASAAFHSFPDTLRFDGISGDYAQNFFGHALNTATYVVNDAEFGWQAFGGNVAAGQAGVTVTPLDSFRTRVYLAPFGLWLTLDAGHFETLEIDAASGVVRVGLAPATGFTPSARLRIEQPARAKEVGEFVPAQAFEVERGAHVVPLDKATTWMELTSRRR
jgi:hypothetical protein